MRAASSRPIPFLLYAPLSCSRVLYRRTLHFCLLLRCTVAFRLLLSPSATSGAIRAPSASPESQRSFRSSVGSTAFGPGFGERPRWCGRRSCLSVASMV